VNLVLSRRRQPIIFALIVLLTLTAVMAIPCLPFGGWDLRNNLWVPEHPLVAGIVIKVT
jgi:hypothetical protein